MVPTLEAIRGGGGSIKVGSTGTISALMSRELDSAKSASKVPSPMASIPVLAGNIPPRKLKTTAGEASSSKSTYSNHKDPETAKRAKHHGRNTHQIPMLKAGDVSVDATPVRRNPIKKGSNVVEIVDIKCGSADRNWVNPITNRLKKLGFSKLSESTI